jgi:hypothetical protein
MRRERVERLYRVQRLVDQRELTKLRFSSYVYSSIPRALVWPAPGGATGTAG